MPPDEFLEPYRQKLEKLLAECKTPEEKEEVEERFAEYMMSVLLDWRLGML